MRVPCERFDTACRGPVVAVPGWDEGVRHFLTSWVSGLMDGLERVDESTRKAILRECGKACADSYTAAVFQTAREQSTDLEGFLAVLAPKFPEATYEPLASGIIQVRYARCACDLVKGGLVTSPLICGCSVYNLQENFERAWGNPVRVTLESSILAGAPQCVFLVSLESPPRQIGHADDNLPVQGSTSDVS